MAETPFAMTIQAALDQGQLTANAVGEDDHVITGTEQTAFALDESKLQSGYNTLMGATPDDAWFSDPTGDWTLYATYGWQPVTTSLVAGTPTSVTVTPGASQAFDLTTFTNSSSYAATFHANATVSVETTLSDTWSNSDTVSVSQSVSYGLKVLGLSGETSFTYTHEWGQSQTQSTATTIGIEAGVEVTLQPNQSAYVIITAIPGTLTMTVPYTATLSGGAAANYGDPCQGHHFWWYYINSILDALKQPTSVAITQNLTFSFYANVSVSVHDASTDEVIQKFDMPSSRPVQLAGWDVDAALLPEAA